MVRKIGVSHMAFFRGWLQGLPLRTVADLYLERDLDLREVKSTLGWVQDELRQKAKLHGRKGEWRLLKMRITEVHKVTAQPAAAPSIDAFREEFDPTGFYTFDELMVPYLERYPATVNRRAERNAKLLLRQLATLNWLESMLVTTPRVDDPMDAWFDDAIATRLANGHIVTLGDLRDRIIERGFRWFTTVPQLGQVRATRLVAWLDGHKTTLGPLPMHALVPAKALKARDKVRPLLLVKVSMDHAASPLIAPLDSLLLPRLPPVSGGGIGPGVTPMITADNDRDAVTAWLNAKAGGAPTRRAYRKEAERLVLWAVNERGLTLSQLTLEDVTSYRDFLMALGRIDAAAWNWRIAQENWIAPRYTKRHTPQWRPFEGPLSPKSVAYAFVVCKALFTFLVKVNYLHYNLWEVVNKPRGVDDGSPTLALTRKISPPAWAALMDSVATMDDEHARTRAQLILRLALETGLRLTELTGALCANVVVAATETGTRWDLTVVGKGGVKRQVPLLPEVMRLIRTNLRERGLPDEPSLTPPDTRLIARWDGKALSDSGLAKLIKGYNTAAAAHLTVLGRPAEARTFMKATAHWIRHTTGASLGDAGVPPSHIQQLLGHKSIATTTIYTNTASDEIYKSALKTFEA